MVEMDLEIYKTVILGLTLFAVLSAPGVVNLLQKKAKILDEKIKNFRELMACRKNEEYNEQRLLEAINLVIVYHGKDKEIQESFQMYREALLSHPKDQRLKGERFIKMVSLIAKRLGFKNIDRLSIHNTIGIKDLSEKGHKVLHKVKSS